MQHIPIELAEAEMILAKEVKRADNPSGPPICGKGVVLTASLIMRLRNLGVQQVCVEGHPLWLEGDRTLEEQLADLDHRFRQVGDHPLMSRIWDLYRAQVRRGMGETDE